MKFAITKNCHFAKKQISWFTGYTSWFNGYTSCLMVILHGYTSWFNGYSSCLMVILHGLMVILCI